MNVHSTCLGYPRIGPHRELKKALERFWAGRSTEHDLLATGTALRHDAWQSMRAAGLTSVPVNDFSFYDHVLDTAVMLGAVPSRFAALENGLTRYFAMARGLQVKEAGVDLPALEMTKWFDTNYHYIVPELADDQTFALDASKVLDEVAEAQQLGLEARPVVIGPVTFLRLSKMAAGSDRSPLALLPRILPAYVELLAALAAEGVRWVQIDEPCLVTDLDSDAQSACRTALRALTDAATRPQILLTTYFGPLRDNLSIAIESGCDGLHVDGIRAAGELDALVDTLPPGRVLSLGLVDGRNVWRCDLEAARARVQRAVTARGTAGVWVSSACSLLHSPVDLQPEGLLDDELKSWLAFARQKLDEIAAIASVDEHATTVPAAVERSRRALTSRATSARTSASAVRQRMADLETALVGRVVSFAEREPLQATRLGLPAFPTTTIGSFPQTADVRDARARWRAGTLADDAYREYLEQVTRDCIVRQEAIGLDVLVHGEFERTDMVEYFGEQLEGFAFTQHGWVQSYGSRCVKPPILYGDVARPRPMTVQWARFAQSLTTRPMKGMLTGPVTILQWSFVRDDQPRRDTCLQIALALRDEVRDLEAAGIAIIQVDEPALREGLPLRLADQPAYLDWAVRAFTVATDQVAADTQIHTHMCYAEFGDILPAVAALDADVISIETSRSHMELLEDFAAFEYPNAIGPGVYDIHSPRVPGADEILALLKRAAEVLPSSHLWVNPDCGLKTRGWPEVELALRNMVAAATEMRRSHG